MIRHGNGESKSSLDRKKTTTRKFQIEINLKFDLNFKKIWLCFSSF